MVSHKSEYTIGIEAVAKFESLPVLSQTLRDRFWGTLGILHDSPPELDYDKFKQMSTGMWLMLGEQDYQKLEKLIGLVSDKTGEIVNQNDVNDLYAGSLDKLRFDDGFPKHIQTMKNILDIYWDEIVKNKLLPPGTTKYFAYTCIIFHDYSRFSNMNGIPIAIADTVSHELLKLSFPEFPQDKYIHDVEYIFGTKNLPPEEDNFFMYFLKLIDTYGKIPRRLMDGFFEKGGKYSLWLDAQIQSGTLPINIDEKIVTAEEYRERDKLFTTRAYDLVKRMITAIDFESAVIDAADMTGGR